MSPLLVLAGSRARLSDGMCRPAVFAGALSYRLYSLHYRLVGWFDGIYRVRFGAQNAAVEAPVFVALAIALSFAFLKVYDEPFRRFLAARIACVESARRMVSRDVQQQ